MRRIVPIRKAAPYTGNTSTTTVYDLIGNDPAFAALWFKIGGRTVAFEDELIAYAEAKARTDRPFVAEEPPKRRRGRPRKQPASQAAE